MEETVGSGFFGTFAAGAPGSATPRALAARSVLRRLSAVQDSTATTAALVQPDLVPLHSDYDSLV
jgi:hypothetical protein